MYCKSATRKQFSQKLVSSFKKKIHSFSVLSNRFWLYLYNSFYCTMCCYLTFLTAVECEQNMD